MKGERKKERGGKEEERDKEGRKREKSFLTSL